MKKYLIFFFCVLQSLVTFSQNPADLGQPFGSYPGFDGIVYSTVIQTDGKIIVSGDFTSYRGINANRIIRLNPDGSKDNSFNTGTGFNNTAYYITIQNDGKIIVSGKFTTYQGVTENCIIRLNTDGSKDTTFISGTGANAVIYCVAIQTDGKIILGGGFTTYQSITTNKIIRLNPNGSKDTSFNIGTGFTGFGITINSIVLQADGKILVGGNFTSYQDNNENRIIRLNTDGSKDNSFNSGNGFDNVILSMVVQPDEKIIIGGNFTAYNGVTENRIIRLNKDGSKDNSFNSGNGFNNAINAILLQSNGKIILGGTFLSYQDVTENQIICLNNDGTKDSSFDSGTGFNGAINSIVIQTDGKIVLGGVFTSYKNVIEDRIICLNSDGSKEISFNTGSGFNGNIRAIALQTDGKIIVGGNFTAYKGKIENRIIRLNTDGTKDTSFKTETGFDSAVGIIKLQTDGKIIVEGAFTSYKGVSENNIIRLNSDGSKDQSFNIGTGFNDVIQSIEVQTDGKIILGGTFTSYQNISTNSIIRLNPDGSKDTSFNSGTGFKMSFNIGSSKVYISTIAIQPDGKIILGGFFDIYNGVSAKAGIIRLNPDGNRDTSFNTGTGFDNAPVSIVIQNDGKIILGGLFTTYQNVGSNHIIRLNSNGSNDTSFNIGTGFSNGPSSISVQTDGKIILGGGYTSYQGNIERNIIRLNSDGSKDSSFITGTSFNSSVYSILQQSDGQILVGGNFTTYKGDNQSAYLIGLKSTAILSNENFAKDKNLFSLWPNPARNILNINAANNSIFAAKIYDLQGKLLYSKEKAEPTIDVSSFNSGTYLINLKNESGETTQKFIKQ
ncbi:MAG TPA: T9SS type A sorting domain-containing protein [Flavobacterium sp.]